MLVSWLFPPKLGGRRDSTLQETSFIHPDNLTQLSFLSLSLLIFSASLSYRPAPPTSIISFSLITALSELVQLGPHIPEQSVRHYYFRWRRIIGMGL